MFSGEVVKMMMWQTTRRAAIAALLATLFAIPATAQLNEDAVEFTEKLGEIVPEDLGIEIIEGARARHCRTFIDGPTALDAFLPLRWLLADSSEVPAGAISLKGWPDQ